MSAKGQALAQGLIGLGSGWLAGRAEAMDRNRQREQEDEEIAWRREQRQAQREQIARDKGMRDSLASAARPAQVDTGFQVTDAAGSDAFTKDADAAAVMSDMVANQRPSLSAATRVQGTAYSDPAQAQAAQSQYNSPPATLERMGLAAMPYDPAKGLSLQGQASTARKAMVDNQKQLEAEVNDRFNAEISSIAFSGPKWWEAAAEMYSKSSMPGLQGVSVKPELSQDGKTVTFVATLPDGTQKRVNTFDASEKGAQDWAQASSKVDGKTKLQWLADRAKYLREQDKMDAEQRNRLELEDVKAGNARSLEGLRQQRPVASRSGGDSDISREERLRYTALFAEAGRRQSEAQKALNTLASQPAYAYAKPGSPQAQELETLRESIRSYAEERKTYQSLLAQGASQGAAAPGLSSARGATGGRSQADRDAERMTILSAELEKARAAGNAADVQALEREIARAGGQQKPPSLSAAQPRPAAGQIPRITTKAERDALPPGTRYVAPNGQTYIKQ